MSDTPNSPAPDANLIREILTPGRNALVTGAASGIGLAAARRFAALGLNVTLVDLPGDALERAVESVRQSAPRPSEIDAAGCNVADRAAMDRLASAIFAKRGALHLLMNNAATGRNPGAPWQNGAGWDDLLGTNLFGVINGVQAFVPAMLEAAQPGLIINTGSKQGITLPPGNSAYNVSKAAVKAYTELLSHELLQANAKLTAHLLIPGFTFTGMTGRAEKPEAAWTADQVIDFMLASIERGDFYVLCPDNDVARELDERRMLWTAQDIIGNRPPLSRWNAKYKEAFARFMTTKDE